MTGTSAALLGVAHHAEQTPDKPALVLGDLVRTYGELDDRARRLACALAERGVRPGSRIAVMLPNGFEFFEAGSAASRLGVNFIPINWHLRGSEVNWILHDSQAVALIAHEEFAAEAQAALAGTTCRPLWVGGPHSEYETAIATANLDADLSAGGSLSTPFMFYTSGTSGKPKGAVADPGGSATGTLKLVDSFGLRSDDVHLLAGPAYHAAPGGWTSIYLALGATTVILARWDAREWLRLAARHHVTTAFLVPTHFARIFDALDEDGVHLALPDLRLVLHAAEPCRVPLKQRVLETFPTAEVIEYYGGSEAGAATAITRDEWLAHRGSVGRAIPGIDIRVLDEQGRPLPAGEDGLVYYTPSGRTRYHNDPEKTARAWHGDLFTVGDYGHLDDDGYLYISDRRDDLILRGGVNIYPREVEDTLMEHPAVLDCAVVGVPDETHGRAVTAVIQLSRPASADEIQSFCRARLATYKCPETIEFVDDLQRDPSGKLRRRHLREWLVARNGVRSPSGV